MRYQRSKADFSLNVKLVEYLHEYDWVEGDNKKLQEFATAVEIPIKTLQDLIISKRTMGPELQARLFLGTNDSRFQPRDDLEQAALREWKENPTPRKTVIGHGDRATAESPHPENPHFFYERVIELLTKYKIGQKGGPQMTAVTNEAKLHKTVLYGMQKKISTITVGIKARLYLSFADQSFAPLNDNEMRQTDFWREQIPRALSFVKGATPDTNARRAEANQEKEIPVPPPSPLEKVLLNSPTFIKAVADKVAAIISNATPQEVTRTIATPTETAGNEFTSDSFIEETRAIFTKAGERLESIMLLANNPRRKIQDELGEKLPQLEDALRRLFLTVRAISKTATGEAARKILEQETSFVNQFKSKEGGK